MGRPKKYLTEEERIAAKREGNRVYAANKRQAQAEAEGRVIKSRRRYDNEEERELARKIWRKKAKDKYRAKLRTEGKAVK